MPSEDSRFDIAPRFLPPCWVRGPTLAHFESGPHSREEPVRVDRIFILAGG
jgi:hypothetical protein